MLYLPGPCQTLDLFCMCRCLHITFKCYILQHSAVLFPGSEKCRLGNFQKKIRNKNQEIYAPVHYFCTRTLEGHISVTNKATEMRQTFSEGSVCALFNRPAAFFIAGRQSPGAGRQPAEPALEKILNKEK